MKAEVPLVPLDGDAVTQPPGSSTDLADAGVGSGQHLDLAWSEYEWKMQHVSLSSGKAIHAASCNGSA